MSLRGSSVGQVPRGTVLVAKAAFPKGSLAATRELNRLELAAETVRCALNALAAACPGWLDEWIAPEWFDRYGRRAEDYRLPRGIQARTDLAAEFGSDGMELLQRVHGPLAPTWLRELPAVQTLRQLWVQQFHIVDGVVRWRTAKDLPPGTARLTTPYDLQARCGLKRAGQRETVWHGYKAHLTETCEPDGPHLITQVTTTVASVPDIAVVDTLHATLAERKLLPEVHVVDAGYVDGRLMTAARAEHGIDLLGPMKASTSWQTSESGYQLENFSIDWDGQQVTCPNGKGSSVWYSDRSPTGLPVIRVEFRNSDCKPCPARSQCTTSKRGRRITLRPQIEHETIQRARADQATSAWRDRYAVRHGIEGTISQAVRSFGLRRSRYRGLAKTRLQHLLTATAINLARVDAWTLGTPFASTRTTPLLKLRPAA